jgi:hypothetical protein
VPVVTSRTRRGAINVLDRGARGDGVTDDYQFLQAVLTEAAATRRAVYIPAAPVRYRVTSFLQATNGVPLIYGDGPASMIRSEDALGLVLELDNADDIVVRDFALSSTLTVRTVTSEGLRLDDCNRVIVDGIYVNGGVSAGILANAGSRITVQNCHVSNTYADGIHFSNSFDVAVLGCSTDTTGDDGIAFVNYGTGSGQPEDPTAFRCKAIGNTTTNSLAAGVASHGMAEVIITGNNVKDTATHGIIVDGEGFFEVRTPARAVITGNTITDSGSLAVSGSYHGIYYEALANTDADTDSVIANNIVVNPLTFGICCVSENTTVTGNIVDMGSSTSIAVLMGSAGAGTTPPDDSVISGNRLYGLSNSGITVTCPTGTQANRVVISNNVVVEPSGGSSDGVNVTRGNGVVVAGNVIEDQGGNARAAIYLDACTNVELGRNSLLGNSTVTLSSCTLVRRDELVVSATPSDTTTYRAGQVAVDTTNNRFAIFNGSTWNVVS